MLASFFGFTLVEACYVYNFFLALPSTVSTVAHMAATTLLELLTERNDASLPLSVSFLSTCLGSSPDINCLVAFVQYSDQCANDRFETSGTDVNNCGRLSVGHCMCQNVLCVPGEVTFGDLMTCRYEDATCQFLPADASPTPAAAAAVSPVPVNDTSPSPGA